MKVTKRRRTYLHLQNFLFVILLLCVAGLVGWVSQRWQLRFDWTYGHRNSLTPATLKVLSKLNGKVTIIAFAPPQSSIAAEERPLLKRYHRSDPKIHFHFLDPNIAVAEARQLHITANGELYLRYKGHGRKLDNISESGITNTLLQLARKHTKTISFIVGHGERRPDSGLNYDLGAFGQVLTQQGLHWKTLNLASQRSISVSKTGVLVLATPQRPLLKDEIARLKHWIRDGGNFLWLQGPGSAKGLATIASQLGIKLLRGTIVTTDSNRFGIDNPTWLVATHYPKSPVTPNFKFETLWPDTTGFIVHHLPHWHLWKFLRSRPLPDSWLVANWHKGAMRYDPTTDPAGPITYGILMARSNPQGSGQQRIAVIGNGNFLSNSFLNNGGNLNLALNVLNWLDHSDQFINIHPPQAPDRNLSLSRSEEIGISLGFLIVIPLLSIIMGALAWLRKRRQ